MAASSADQQTNIQIKNTQKLITTNTQCNDHAKITKEDLSAALAQVQIKVSEELVNIPDVSNKNKQSKIVGNNSENEDLVAKKKHWIFATKYKSSYKKETLEEYLQEKFPNNNFIVEQVSHYGTYNSFKIGIDENIKEDIFHPNTWPKGIEVSDYFFRRKNYQHYGRNGNKQRHWRSYSKPQYTKRAQ